MANGIAQMIQGMRQPQPVTNFLQGMQSGQAIQQNRLAQQQAKQQMTDSQRQQDIQTLGGLLQGVQDEQGYQQAIEMAQKMGVGEQTLGGLKQVMPQFDTQTNQRLLGAYGFTPEKPKFGSPIQALDENGNPTFVQVSDTGEVRPVQGYGPMPKGGMSVTLADGTKVQVGGSGSQLQKKTVGDIEGKQLDTMEAASRLEGIKESFKPEYLTYGASFDAARSRLKEKAGMSLDPQEKEFLSEFSNFKRQSISNVNRTIKQLTGAAMSQGEAERIMKELPDPGTGLIDGDSPTEFKSKLDGAVRDSKRALARYHYARQKGLDPLESNIDLTDVDKLIDMRGQELERAIAQQNPNASPQQIEQAVQQRLKQEFGL